MNEKALNKIDKMYKKLIKVLLTDDVPVGASTMLAILIRQAQTDNKFTKEIWLEDLSRAWDYYKKMDSGNDSSL